MGASFRGIPRIMFLSLRDDYFLPELIQKCGGNDFDDTRSVFYNIDRYPHLVHKHIVSVYATGQEAIARTRDMEYYLVRIWPSIVSFKNLTTPYLTPPSPASPHHARHRHDKPNSTAPDLTSPVHTLTSRKKPHPTSPDPAAHHQAQPRPTSPHPTRPRLTAHRLTLTS